MIRVYAYNDLKGFSDKRHNVRSNLCTWYYDDKNRFCGNYSSRRGVHGHAFNRRCWRHKRMGMYSASLPPVVLLMISSGERFYNRDRWVRYLSKAERKGVPLELVIYHEDMLNCTVRESHNLLSRFRPFPDIFGSVLPLKNDHGGINFGQIHLRMLDYGCKIPYAARCVVISERTIPIRSPRKVYNSILASKCYVDISYNVKFSTAEPPGLPQGPRGKPFQAVNNLCMGLFTTEFLKEALPTVPEQCGLFGLTYTDGVYTVTNREVLDAWQRYTWAAPDEFWLLNSFLLSGKRIAELASFMEKTDESDYYTVAEIPEWRGDVKRTFIFRDWKRKERIPYYDQRLQSYFKGKTKKDSLNLRKGVSLRRVIRYLRKHKRRALFFRNVELP